MNLSQILANALKLRFARRIPKGSVGSRRYPEQSKRQANRRFRRAQGGPGLDANNEPRGVV